MFSALACDYDGTLAQNGHVNDAVLAELKRWRYSGKRLILLTGRILPELKSVFPSLSLFNRVVVENGALLYRPDTNEEILMGSPLPDAFYKRLREHGIKPLIRGRVIIATRCPNES